MPSSEFQSTQWSIVLKAGRADAPAARDALAVLCQRYWRPLYAFVLRTGAAPEQAEDATQGFFTRLIEKQAIEHAAPSRGRFRSFLLASLRNYLANEHDRATARKRGGGRPVVSLDAAATDPAAAFEPAHSDTPERAFDRAWALQLLERVVDRLRREAVDKGKAAEFEALQPFLSRPSGEASYDRAAAALGLSPAAVRQAASRLRKRYREVLRAEAADTVSSPDEVEDEIRSLFDALSR